MQSKRKVGQVTNVTVAVRPSHRKTTNRSELTVGGADVAREATSEAAEENRGANMHTRKAGTEEELRLRICNVTIPKAEGTKTRWGEKDQDRQNRRKQQRRKGMNRNARMRNEKNQCVGRQEKAVVQKGQK